MTQQHPITPPPELVQQWWKATPIQFEESDPDPTFLLATRAAQWGADQELEACCEYLKGLFLGAENLKYLRAARRPKPPSLKEQALEALMTADGPDHPTPMLYLRPDAASIIRRALEQLPGDQ